MKGRTYLRLRIAAFFAAIFIGGVLAFAGALWLGWTRAGGPAEGYILAGIIGGFALLAATAWVGFLFDENVSRPIMGLARELSARAATEVNVTIDQHPGRYLGQLAPAARAIDAALSQARSERDSFLARQTEKIERDKALLAILIRDLPQAVIIISNEKRILLFNRAAKALLGELSLERDLSRFLETTPIDFHIANTSDITGSFVSSSRQRDGWIDGSISQFGVEERPLGYILLCSPLLVGKDIKSHGARGARVAGASPLSVFLNENTLSPTLRHRIGDLHISCDALLISQLCEGLIDHVKSQCRGQDFEWDIAPDLDDGLDRLKLVLRWHGAPCTQPQLAAFTCSSARAPYAPLTWDQALSVSHSRLACDDTCALYLDLPLGRPNQSLWRDPIDHGFSMPSLFSGSTSRLGETSFVIFDTETTGLDCDKDEVIQIAGVRMLRGQILRNDSFDELVNPGRPIPPSSTAIHGIDDKMVQSALPFSAVAEAFKSFVDDGVLVAHNAAFDRAFFDRLAAQGGLVIERPMLCTALLSRALNPQIASHTLDALAERYGVTIPPQLRHTALGDARATAELLQKMLPILEERGIDTLAKALEFQKQS